MPSDTLMLLAILILAFCIYFPIIRIAKKDMETRTMAGMSTTPILMFLLLPLVGPLLYVLFRKNFLP